MSSEGLKRNIGKFILDEFERTKLNDRGIKDSRVTRKELERSNGQIFIINEVDVRQEIDFIANKVGVETLDSGEFNQLMMNIDSVFKKNIAPTVSAERLERVTGLLKWLKNKNANPNLHYYIINNFRQVQSAKSANGKLNSTFTNALSSKFKKRNPAKAKAIAGSITGLAKKGEALSGFQLGHGEHGGLASSTVDVAKVKKAGFDKFVEGSKERAVFKEVIHEYEKKLNLNIKHDQILDSSGKLDKNYIVILSLQGAESNQQDNRLIESPALENIKRRAKTFVQQDSSTKLTDAIEKILMGNMARNLKSFFRLKPKKKIKETSASKQKGKAKFSKKEKVMVAGGLAGRINTEAFQRSRGQSNTPALLNLLATRLPGMVMKNMTVPSLINRSGTFANSVQIMGINDGAIPIINYTYQKDPYQVFENTAPWADGKRDPRDLIDKSIREIAAESIRGKFITRRL